MPIRVVSVIGPATQLILNRRDVILCIEKLAELINLHVIHSAMRIPVIVSSDSGRNVSTDSGAS